MSLEPKPENDVFLDGNDAAVKGDIYRLVDAHGKLAPHLDEVDIGRLVGRILDGRQSAAGHGSDLPCGSGRMPVVLFESAQEVFDAFCHGILSIDEARRCFGLDAVTKA